jgi:hypothetical protein
LGGWHTATRQSLENTRHLYAEAREHILSSLSAFSQRCNSHGSGQKGVVFYASGDLAEIAYVSLQATDLAPIGWSMTGARGDSSM